MYRPGAPQIIDGESNTVKSLFSGHQWGLSFPVYTARCLSQGMLNGLASIGSDLCVRGVCWGSAVSLSVLEGIQIYRSFSLIAYLPRRTPGRLSTLLIFNFHGFKIARHVQASIADPQTQFLLREEGRQPWRQGGRRGGGGGRYQAKMAACRVPGERPLRSAK